MAKIWANRLIDGTRWTWDDVPDARKTAVMEELRKRVADGDITAEKYEEITGEVYSEGNAE